MGEMTVDRMLAHCNVTFELVYEDKHPKPNGFKKWMLKTFLKNIVVSEKPYKKNGRTAAEFIVTSEKDFKKKKKTVDILYHKITRIGKQLF